MVKNIYLQIHQKDEGSENELDNSIPIKFYLVWGQLCDSSKIIKILVNIKTQKVYK